MSGPPTEEGVYIECVQQGGLLKVSAIDPKTGTEASVFGPIAARPGLIRNAVAKLKMVMKRANSE
jgi:hypothetical protein